MLRGAIPATVGLVAATITIAGVTPFEEYIALATQLATIPHEDLYIIPAVRELLEKYGSQ